MKGIFNLKPSLPKYSKIWDIKQLFDYYRSLPLNYDLDEKRQFSLFYFVNRQRQSRL